MYRQERLEGCRLRVKVLRLFGHQHDSVVGVVTIHLVDTISSLIITSATSRVSLKGTWNQQLDLMLPISELTDKHALQVHFNDRFVYTLSILDPNDHRYLRRGLVKVQIAGPPPSERVAEYDRRVVSQVQSGTWRSMDWLDRLTFNHIADLQLQEARESKQLFLLLEMRKWEGGGVRMRDGLRDLMRQRPVDPLAVASSPPSAHLPPPPSGTIIKPSPRSAPILQRLQREGCSCAQLPAAAPGLLWKYKSWITGCCDNPRLCLLFMKSVDWLDGEELRLAKECIAQFSNTNTLALSVSAFCLLMLNPHLACFDCDLHGILTRSQPEPSPTDDVLVYAMCMFIKNTTATHFPILHQHVTDRLKQATETSLYAAMAVYWLLEREDLVAAGGERREMMGKQRMLIDNLQSLIDIVRSDQDSSRVAKKERLVAMLQDPPDRCPPLLVPFLSVALPTEPAITISGVIPEHTAVYKSTQMPVRVSFLSDPHCSAHSVIIKTGEAVDGDLMVMQTIRIIDQLWRQNNLSLHIQTYSILPIPHQQGGWLQFVPSVSLYAILRDHGNSLLPFLLTQENAERYVRSCAGYCVISYLLGVGDRHLENLLLTTDGRLFHVDYAFLFGADPKPFPPPMKLCREMVEAMGGGQGSPEFRRFKRLLLQAYQIVRLNGGLVLDFLAIHGTLVGEPELRFVRDRLALDKTDQQALEEMDRLVDESVTAMFPQVMEAIHKWAQYWRA